MGEDIVHTSVARKRTVVGQGSLQDFFSAYFGTSQDIGSVLIAAENDYGVRKSPEHEITRDLTQAFGSEWSLVWPTTAHFYPALPKWLHKELGLQTGRQYQMSFRFSYQTGWYPFQRVTDEDAAAVEGALITVQSIDT